MFRITLTNSIYTKTILVNNKEDITIVESINSATHKMYPLKSGVGIYSNHNPDDCITLRYTATDPENTIWERIWEHPKAGTFEYKGTDEPPNNFILSWETRDV